MNQQRLFLAVIACALSAMTGCGGADVVSVDRATQSNSSNRRPTKGISPTNTSSRPSAGRSENTNSSESGTGANAGPSVAATDSVPTITPTTNTPATPAPTNPIPAGTNTPGINGTPTGPPAPEPSDYRVLLPTGDSLDIGELLDKERDEFEQRIDTIAQGDLMLRTYYIQEEAGTPTGDLPAATDVPTGDLPAANPAAAPGIPAPATPSAQPNPSRQPRRATGRPGSRSSRRPLVRRNVPPPVFDMSRPFMDIGRIAATLRGPTAAYYRDGAPMMYLTYDRDSRRNGTLISWDEKERPVAIDQFFKGKRNGMRVLFRTRSDNDPTGYVAMVQEWRAGRLLTTHLVAEHGEAQTIDPDESQLDETGETLLDILNELDEFDKTLRDNEKEVRKALTAMYREEVRRAKGLRPAPSARGAQTREQILQELTSVIRSPGDWRKEYQIR